MKYNEIEKIILKVENKNILILNFMFWGIYDELENKNYSYVFKMLYIEKLTIKEITSLASLDRKTIFNIRKKFIKLISYAIIK